MVQVKRVRFSESCESYASSWDYENPLDRSNWLTNAEWMDIRRQALEVVDFIKNGDMIWSHARKQPYIATMLRVWETCCERKKLSAVLKKELRFWTTIGHSRRGLERFSLPEIQCERNRLRRRHALGILFVQDQCYDNNLDFDSTSYLLRLTSEKLSREFSMFALLLAEADADAALSVDGKSRKLRGIVNNDRVSAIDQMFNACYPKRTLYTTSDHYSNYQSRTAREA